MGEYKTGEFYDDFKSWQGIQKFAPPFPRNSAYTRMDRVARHPYITKDTEIVDIGAGPGEQAAVIWHHGIHTRYRGIDFSPGSVAFATERNKAVGHQMAEFTCGDLFKFLKKLKVDVAKTTFICGEVLEHLEGEGRDDLALLELLPSGAKCVFDVPSFDAESHVRWFPKQAEVTARYSRFFNEWWITSLVYSTKSLRGHSSGHFRVVRVPTGWIHLFSGIKK